MGAIPATSRTACCVRPGGVLWHWRLWVIGPRLGYGFSAAVIARAARIVPLWSEHGRAALGLPGAAGIGPHERGGAVVPAAARSQGRVSFGVSFVGLVPGLHQPVLLVGGLSARVGGPGAASGSGSGVGSGGRGRAGSDRGFGVSAAAGCRSAWSGPAARIPGRLVRLAGCRLRS
jgi:hypothetical protein